MEKWRSPVTRKEALELFTPDTRVRYRDPAIPWTGTVTPMPHPGGRCVEGFGVESGQPLVWVRVSRDDSGTGWYKADSLETITD